MTVLSAIWGFHVWSESHACEPSCEGWVADRHRAGLEHGHGGGGVRISVEHAFGIMLQEWPFMCCSWKHQILGTACGLWYCVSVLLTNAHNCFVPNQTVLRYDCMPPSIQDYFHS